MKIGSSEINAIKIGSTAISKVYKNGVLYWHQGVLIPSHPSVLFWLDGTIIDVGGIKYFQDKSPHGRNFLITGYDFDTSWAGGFPYKSGATISAPVGDSALIAADINNFLYDSGGTPNQIPVVSLFQDIDYEHRLFCRHIAQSVDGNGVETYAPRVMEVVFYNAARSGNDLTLCQSYYGVPVEVSSNVKWVSPSGSDTLNDGSKASPYRTFSKALGIAGITKIYVKTGLYNYENYLDIVKAIDIQGTGYTVIDPTNASYAFYVHKTPTSAQFTISNLRVVSSGSGIYFASNNTNNTIRLTSFSGGTTHDLWTSSGDAMTVQYSKITKRLSNIYGNTVIDTCLISDINTSNTYSASLTVKNSKITVGSTIGASSSLNLFGNKIVESKLSFISSTPIIEFFSNEFSFNTVTASGHLINSATPIKIYNNVINVTAIPSGYNLINIAAVNCWAYNNIIDSYSTNTYADIHVNGSTSVPTTAEVYGNKIKHRALGGHAVLIGGDGGGGPFLISSNVYNNVCLGASYLDQNVLPASSTAHMILVGFLGTGFSVHHNYCSGGSPGIGLKGDNSHDYTNGKVYSNICKDNYNNYICQGVKNAKLYNCLSIQTKEIQRHYSFGEAVTGVCENNEMKNCIAYGLGSNTNAISVNVGSLTGFQSDYNCIYIPNKSNWMNTQLGVSNVTDWQAAGFDTHSIFVDPLITGLVPSAVSPVIDAGTDLGADYNSGLDATTNWGSDTELPQIVTRAQSGAWDIGPYLR